MERKKELVIERVVQIKKKHIWDQEKKNNLKGQEL